MSLNKIYNANGIEPRINAQLENLVVDNTIYTDNITGGSAWFDSLAFGIATGYIIEEVSETITYLRFQEATGTDLSISTLNHLPVSSTTGSNIMWGATNTNLSATTSVILNPDKVVYNTPFQDIIAIGYDALSSITGGSLVGDDIAIGTNALKNNKLGNNNVAIGSDSLTVLNDDQNVAVGSVSGFSLTGGNNNTFLGYDADTQNGYSQNRTVIGAQAVGLVDNSVMLGGGAVNLIDNPYDLQVNIGSSARRFNNIYGNYVSVSSLTPNQLVQSDATGNLISSTGAPNTVPIETSNGLLWKGNVWLTNSGTFVGQGAGASGIQIGNDGGNQAFGLGALASNCTGSAFNSAFGSSALNLCSVGANNSAFGFQGSLRTMGNNNSAFGFRAIRGANGINDTGSNNSAFGYLAMGGVSSAVLTTGQNNSVFGSLAGSQISSGNENCLIGSNAGASGTSITTGNANTLIGTGSSVNSASAQNRTALGQNASATADNSVMLGNSSVNLINVATDNQVALGSSSSRFSTVYAVNLTGTNLNIGTNITYNASPSTGAFLVSNSAGSLFYQDLIRAGTSSTTGVTGTITFSSPLPSTGYIIMISPTLPLQGSGAVSYWPTPLTATYTTSGCAIQLTDTASSAVASANQNFQWQAIMKR